MEEKMSILDRDIPIPLSLRVAASIAAIVAVSIVAPPLQILAAIFSGLLALLINHFAGHAFDFLELWIVIHLIEMVGAVLAVFFCNMRR